MPVFVPAIGISLSGIIKYPEIVDIKMLAIQPRYSSQYPSLPVAEPRAKTYGQGDLKLISKMMFGIAKSKIPDLIAFLLQPENKEAIEQNNALIQAKRAREATAARAGIY